METFSHDAGVKIGADEQVTRAAKCERRSDDPAEAPTSS